MKANFIGTYLQSGNNNWFCRYICMYKCWEGYNLSALNIIVSYSNMVNRFSKYFNINIAMVTCRKFKLKMSQI